MTCHLLAQATVTFLILSEGIYMYNWNMYKNQGTMSCIVARIGPIYKVMCKNIQHVLHAYLLQDSSTGIIWRLQSQLLLTLSWLSKQLHPANVVIPQFSGTCRPSSLVDFYVLNHGIDKNHYTLLSKSDTQISAIVAFQNPPTFGEYLWLSWIFDMT